MFSPSSMGFKLVQIPIFRSAILCLAQLSVMGSMGSALAITLPGRDTYPIHPFGREILENLSDSFAAASSWPVYVRYTVQFPRLWIAAPADPLSHSRFDLSPLLGQLGLTQFIGPAVRLNPLRTATANPAEGKLQPLASAAEHSDREPGQTFPSDRLSKPKANLVATASGISTAPQEDLTIQELSQLLKAVSGLDDRYQDFNWYHGCVAASSGGEEWCTRGETSLY